MKRTGEELSRLRRTRARRPPPQRYLAPIGDRDIDRWVNEGLSAFGSLARAVQAGAWAGAALPWLFATFSLVYAWVNNWFAPPDLRDAFGPARLWELLLRFGVSLIGSTLLFATIGALFGLVRQRLLRMRFQSEEWRFPFLGYVCDSRLAAAIMGWIVYVVWALWPRDIDGGKNFAGALEHTWLWVFFGVLFSMYFHWGQITVLYRLYYRDWSGACAAVAERLLKGNLRVQVPCRVEADERTGELRLYGFPRGEGIDRIRDLLWRVPGVRHLQIEEVGEPKEPDREIITLHIPYAPVDAFRNRLITLARLAFAAGALTGPLAYVIGLAYIISEGMFFQWSSLVVLITLQVEAIGLSLGYVARTLLIRRAQRELPRSFERILHFAGKDLHGFSHGRTWEEVHLIADVSRAEARELLTPVATRFGLRRLLIETPVERRLRKEA